MAKIRSRITWNAWGDTHPGKLRENNEDRIFCDPEQGIFIVVDGMGGEAAGEIAAQNALDCIRRRLGEETGTVARRIREAITAANNEVYRLAQSNPEWRGMACVLTVAVIEEGTLHVGHVGDSRLYLIRDHMIRKITPDHSPVGRREDARELTELEAMRHPRRNEVFRDVGSQPRKPDEEGFIDYLQLPLEADSTIILCSDGLSDMLTSSEMLKTIELKAGNLRESVRQLIAQANSAGGKDNISVIVLQGNDFASAVRTPCTQPGAAAAASAPGVERKPRPAIFRWLAGPWQMFVSGVLVGAFAIAFFQSWNIRKSESGSEQEGVNKPRTWVVDPSAAEYRTIGQVLDKARPGDLVSVARGEYREPIRLRDGVAVVAQVPGEVLIHVSNPLSLQDAAVIAEGIKGAELNGFVIRAGPEKAFPIGIRIINSDVKVTNVEVSGAAEAGIWIGGTSHGILAASHIYGNAGPGIVVAGTARPRIVGNIVQENGLGAERPGPGILVTDSSDPEVLRNVIAANAAEGIRLRQVRLKDRMMGNFFSAAGKPNKAGAIGVEKAGK